MTRILFIATILFSASLVLFADAAPPLETTFVRAPFSLQSDFDFPDYQFFLQSSSDLVEIGALKKDDNINYEPAKEGASNEATLIAIPAKNTVKISENFTPEELAQLNQEIISGKVQGVLRLVTHNFRKELTPSDPKNLKKVIYVLEKDEKGLPKVSPFEITKKVGIGKGIDNVSPAPSSRSAGYGILFISALILVPLCAALWLYFRNRNRSRVGL